MAKITTKIAVPIILVGVFGMAVLLAIGYVQPGPSFYIVILFFVIFMFFFGLAIGQNLSSPIKKILNQAVELSKGNLSSRVDLETKDELADLAKVFNKIAEELEASQMQAEGAEKSVGVKVRAKTQDFEETINALEQKVKNRTIEMEKMSKELARLQEEVKNKK